MTNALQLNRLVLVLVMMTLSVHVTGQLLRHYNVRLSMARTRLFQHRRVIFILFMMTNGLLFNRELLHHRHIGVSDHLARRTLLHSRYHRLINFAFRRGVNANGTIGRLLNDRLIARHLNMLVNNRPRLIRSAIVTTIVGFTIGLRN